MGGCATKPKVLKGDEGEVPSPAPEPAAPSPAPPPEPKKEPVPAVPEAKEAADHVDAERVKEEAVVVVDEAAKKEAVNGDDDQENKRKPLNNLLKDQVSADNDQSEYHTPSEPKLSGLMEHIETVKQEVLKPVKQVLSEPSSKQDSPPETTAAEAAVKKEEKTTTATTKSETEKLKEVYETTIHQKMEEPNSKPLIEQGNNTVEAAESVIQPGKIESIVQTIEAKSAPAETPPLAPPPAAAVTSTTAPSETQSVETPADAKTEVAK